jgi:hypothetical protein
MRRGYDYRFNDADAERWRNGLVPDKWFAYFVKWLV